MTGKVAITLKLTLQPEAADAFCARLPAMIEETARRPGFREIRILRDGNMVQFFEIWDSERQYDDYIAFRTEEGTMDAMAAILAGPPEKQVWPTLVASA